MTLGQELWGMPAEIVAILGIVVLVAVVAALFFASVGSLYIQALVSGAPVTVTQLIGMRLRRVNVRSVVYGRIRAVKAGLDMPIHLLEVHYLAGGNVSVVVAAMVLARNGGLDLTWDAAATIDLAGQDVVRGVRERLEREGRTPREDAEYQEWYRREVEPFLPTDQRPADRAR